MMQSFIFFLKLTLILLNSTVLLIIMINYYYVSIILTFFIYLIDNYYSNAQNRREFFLSVAKRDNFDPLLPRSWYTISYSSFKKTQVIFSLSLSLLSYPLLSSPLFSFSHSSFIITIIIGLARNRQTLFKRFPRGHY